MLKNRLHKKLLTSVLVFTTLLSGCVSDMASVAGAFFTSPSVAVTSITPKDVANGNLAFDVGLKVTNPNAIPLPISTVSSRIALNGLQLLSASASAQNVIPAGGSEAMTLSASIGTSQIKTLLSTLNSPRVSYDLSGNVGVSGTGITLLIQHSGSVNTVDLATKLIRASLSR